MRIGTDSFCLLLNLASDFIPFQIEITKQLAYMEMGVEFCVSLLMLDQLDKEICRYTICSQTNPNISLFVLYISDAIFKAS